jgi:hypothetical protein
MRRSLPLLLTLLAFAAAPASATDRNGGDDCTLFPHVDWGDAPEGVLAYPGVTGKFPTCRQMNVVGTQEVAGGCPPISSPPGITGHLFHRPSNASQYWLGCYTDPQGRPSGFDGEGEGLMNQPAQGSSFCSTHEAVDCVENAYGLTFGQDECTADQSDAGVISSLEFGTCQSGSVTFTTYSCATAPRNVVLNVAIDWNHDGDWNDVVACANGTCAYEWAVKNEIITLPPGCGTITSPAFLAGSTAGPAWLRISLSDDLVSNDYPWTGAAGESGVEGGETEDYPAMVVTAVPTLPSTWGAMKATYR